MSTHNMSSWWKITKGMINPMSQFSLVTLEFMPKTKKIRIINEAVVCMSNDTLFMPMGFDRVFNLNIKIITAKKVLKKYKNNNNF